MKKTLLAAMALLAGALAQAQVSETPGTPFKLATFTANGEEHAGMLVGDRLVDIREANAWLVREAGADPVDLPATLLGLIEQSASVKPRLFRIANYLGGRLDDIDFAFDPADVTFEIPIRYPSNLLAAGQNYRAHAAETGGRTDIDPDKDDPFLFAKSPRSAIIATNTPYPIPPGRDHVDWEGEFAVVVGRQAKNLTLDNALDYVFGFTIMFDVSDRAAQKPAHGRYERDWFAGKSMDNAAPMGPYIVPIEFLPNHAKLQVRTRVNGQLMQDSDTSYLIHDVKRLLRYATSIMTLWPGDVIATGTPEGVGEARNPPVFLKSGDTVEIEIEGIGTLVTPIR